MLHQRYSAGVALDSVQKRIISDLKTQGYAVTHIAELFPGENIFVELEDYMRPLLSVAERQEKKKFLVSLWGKGPMLDPANPFMSISWDRKILEIVNAYLGVFSEIQVFTLNKTEPISSGAVPRQSQRWHRDPEDKMLCKMFLYMNDVDEKAGPFMYVAYSNYGNRYNAVFPQRSPKGVYPKNGAVENCIPKGDIRTLTGKAGTVIFADTAGLHRGGYATHKERIMLTTNYVAKTARRKKRFIYPENFEKLFITLHPLAQHALKKK